jgi:hypothetical protein
MIFNSLIFFVFYAVVIAGFFGMRSWPLRKGFLVLASFIFYATLHAHYGTFLLHICEKSQHFPSPTVASPLSYLAISMPWESAINTFQAALTTPPSFNAGTQYNVVLVGEIWPTRLLLDSNAGGGRQEKRNGGQ